MFKFKSFEDYKAQRDAAIGEAQALLNDGDMDKYNEKVKYIEDMDAAYEEFAEMQANLAALQGAVKPPLGVVDRESVIESITQGGDMEYRQAFRNYVLRGGSVPKMGNSDATTSTSDVGAVIPNTIMDRIIEKIEGTGNILAKVMRTYYKGGVSVPISAAKPVATWTSERGTTDKQKKDVGHITFTYFKLKIQVAVSVIVDNVTLDVFERTIANNIAEAVIRALETAIINGSGSGQPKGILAENPLDGQNIDIAKGGKITYQNLCDMEAALPSAYDNAEWCMNKKTFISQIVGMVDSNGQPVARMNAGIDGKPSYTILGRHVEFSEDVTAAAATITEDTVIAFMFRFADYMLNTNMGMTVSRYTDNDTDDEVTKAIMLADGKVIDKNSLVTMTLKNE